MTFLTIFRTLSCLMLSLHLAGGAWADGRSVSTAPTGTQLETGAPSFRNIGPWEYGAAPQNWALTQDHQGLIYVGNSHGILEFDGVTWRLIPTSNQTCVRSLDRDASGRIWVGAQNDLGYLEADSSGTKAYVSLVPKLAEKDRDFGDVWATLSSPHGVFFFCSHRLFRLNDQGIQVLDDTSGSAKWMFRVGQQIFLQHKTRGLLEWADTGWRNAPEGETFAETWITDMLPWENEGQPPAILVATASAGLFLMSQGKVLPFRTEAAALLRESMPQCCLRLSDGTLAVGTLQRGVLLLTRDGKVLGHLSKANGLQDDGVHCLFADRQGGLWMGFDNGLARADWPSPLTYFTTQAGIQGNVLSLCRVHDEVLVGTGRGVFRLARDPQRGSHFVPVQNTHQQNWCFLNTAHGLLLGSNSGLLEIKGDRATSLLRKSERILALHPSRREPERIFVGMQRGIMSLAWRDGAWRDEGTVPKVDWEIRALHEDSDGSIWACTRTNGVLRLTFPGAWKPGALMPPPQVEAFGTGQGLPSMKHTLLISLEGKLRFATHQGIYQFDESVKAFKPDTRFASVFQNGPRWVEWVLVDEQNRLWMKNTDEARRKSEMGVAIPGKDGRFHWDTTMLGPISGMDIQSGYADRKGVMWLGGSEGLVRFDPGVRMADDLGIPSLLRRVSRGAETLPLNTSHPDLPFTSNRLRFEFAAPGFEKQETIRYQVFMEGYDKDWSSGQTEAFKEYTNLHEGSYRFRVRCRNLRGKTGSEATFSFRVFPPWYRTAWAYAGYVFLLAGQGIGLVRWRAKKSRQEKAELEAKVQERTHALAESTRQLLAAQEKITDLMENSHHTLDNIPSWAISMGREIQRTLGIAELSIFAVEADALVPMAPENLQTPPSLSDVAASIDSRSRFGDSLIIPARGLTGELLAVLLVRGLAGQGSGADRQLLNGFANQLGSALDMVKVRRRLAKAVATQTHSLEGLQASGIETLKLCPQCNRCFSHTATHCDQDGTALEIPAILPLRLQDRYRFVRQLGEGGMGRVFEAHDEQLDRIVAVKLMRPEWFNDLSVRLRFEQEARSLVQVNHPSVVTVYDSGEVGDGTLFLIMERLSGMELGFLLKHFGPGSPGQVARLVRQGAEALEAAHRARIIHRDIKPQNLFLIQRPTGLHLKLLDFGLARSVGSETRLTQAGFMIGTPAYMAPEQILGQEADARSDLFAFATVMYEALLGRPTVTATDLPEVIQTILHESPMKPSALIPAASPFVDAAFLAGLVKDRTQRPPHLMEWASGLADALENLPLCEGGWPEPLPAIDVPEASRPYSQADITALVPLPLQEESSRPTRILPKR